MNEKQANKQIKTVLKKKLKLSFFFYRDGHSVLIHGSDGTDSSLVISTLAQLIMDPRCRTLEGFLGLLEREWIQVMHVSMRQRVSGLFAYRVPKSENIQNCLFQRAAEFIFL